MGIRAFALSIARMLPDREYIGLQYYAMYKKLPNLRNPESFSEKLNWMKLYDRKQEYTKLADKYAVRSIMQQLIGEQYLVPLYGVWDKPEDIDYNCLPEQFVLKCNHDSGSVIICRDKNTFDISEANRKLNYHLGRSAFEYAREWPYKNINPKVMAEQYMCPDIYSKMVDYKFYCFGGKPEFLYVSEGLEDHSKAFITFYDLQGRRTPFQRPDYPMFEIDPIFPDSFNMMIKIAGEIATYIGNPFIRVDLYSVQDRIYFSEVTFTPCGGYMKIDPPEWDRYIGEMICMR